MIQNLCNKTVWFKPLINIGTLLAIAVVLGAILQYWEAATSALARLSVNESVWGLFALLITIQFFLFVLTEKSKKDAKPSPKLQFFLVLFAILVGGVTNYNLKEWGEMGSLDGYTMAAALVNCGLFYANACRAVFAFVGFMYREKSRRN